MKLFIKNDLDERRRLILSGTFSYWIPVVDENEICRYRVPGLGNEMRVCNSRKKGIANIKKKFLSLTPRFFVEIEGQHVFTIVRNFTMFGSWQFWPRYRIYGFPWRVKGSFLGSKYVMVDTKKQQRMRLVKKAVAWGELFELDIANPDDELPCLCIALAIMREKEILAERAARDSDY
jgi:uncharacterized protein YxjI